MKKNKTRKVYQGVVISNKMDHTVVAEITRYKIHPIYMKKYIVSKKYKIDCDNSKFKIGDNISFIETKPISKNKHFKVMEQDD